MIASVESYSSVQTLFTCNTLWPCVLICKKFIIYYTSSSSPISFDFLHSSIFSISYAKPNLQYCHCSMGFQMEFIWHFRISVNRITDIVKSSRSSINQRIFLSSGNHATDVVTDIFDKINHWALVKLMNLLVLTYYYPCDTRASATNMAACAVQICNGPDM